MTTEIDDSALYPRPGVVTLYTIYDHPRDHPGYFVVRPWDVDPKSDPQARLRIAPNGQPVCGLFAELETAREYCAQFGLVKLTRAEHDDPSVIEVWL